LCGETLQKSEMELELHFVANGDDNATTVVVHPRCFVAFETQARTNDAAAVLPAEDDLGTIERHGGCFPGPGAKWRSE
jgi:hypothetical protein